MEWRRGGLYGRGGRYRVGVTLQWRRIAVNLHGCKTGGHCTVLGQVFIGRTHHEFDPNASTSIAMKFGSIFCHL